MSHLLASSNSTIESFGGNRLIRVDLNGRDIHVSFADSSRLNWSNPKKYRAKVEVLGYPYWSLFCKGEVCNLVTAVSLDQPKSVGVVSFQISGDSVVSEKFLLAIDVDSFFAAGASGRLKLLSGLNSGIFVGDKWCLADGCRTYAGGFFWINDSKALWRSSSEELFLVDTRGDSTPILMPKNVMPRDVVGFSCVGGSKAYSTARGVWGLESNDEIFSADSGWNIVSISQQKVAVISSENNTIRVYEFGKGASVTFALKAKYRWSILLDDLLFVMTAKGGVAYTANGFQNVNIPCPSKPKGIQSVGLTAIACQETGDAKLIKTSTWIL